MELMDAIRGRRAIREFTAEPVEKDAIREIIAAAVRAPSAMNLQPWAFAVVVGAPTLTRYSAAAKQHLLETIDAASPMAGYRSHLADPAFDIFYGAPALIVVCATQPGGQATEDCCNAAQTLLLAAHARGLGTCWIGFARPWLGLPPTKAELGIPAAYAPVAPIIVGHPRAVPAPTARREPEIIWCKAT
jgi:nitroreductase